MTVVLEPDTATNKTVTWTSSNETVATVTQDDTVTAVGAGTAVITATTQDGGYAATCAVTDTQPYPPEEDNSAPTYSITLREIEGGEVMEKKLYAEESETFRFTVTPNEGYELEKFTVTNSQGRELDLTYKGGNEYTFQMPAGRVEIKVSFQEIVVEPEPLPFTDVPENAWYTDAVRYVHEHGLMSGTSATAFSPDTTSRSTIAAIRQRMAGSPVANYAMDYADVAQGQWYSETIRWATSEGIVGGLRKRHLRH